MIRNHNILCLVKFILVIFLIIPLSTFATTPIFKKIVFFGDSLSDNGNLYRFTVGYFPKSPPYSAGRFSNGLVWTDYVAKYFMEHGLIPSFNYAVGGETVLLHDPRSGYLPYTLTFSVNNYLVRSAFSDRTDTLFVLWVGSNDYLQGDPAPDLLTNNVIARITNELEKLVYRGGQYFLILTLPDLDKTPAGRASPINTVLSELITQHNRKLINAVAYFKKIHPKVIIELLDVNRMFKNVLENPEKYNQKYHLHITNITQACWGGGYHFGETYNQNKISNLENKPAVLQENSPLQDELSNENLNQGILLSPSLKEAFRVAEAAKQGMQPCKNPEEYIFWDSLHPTTNVHMMLSARVIKAIEEKF